MHCKELDFNFVHRIYHLSLKRQLQRHAGITVNSEPLSGLDHFYIRLRLRQRAVVDLDLDSWQWLT